MPVRCGCQMSLNRMWTIKLIAHCSTQYVYRKSVLIVLYLMWIVV